MVVLTLYWFVRLFTQDSRVPLEQSLRLRVVWWCRDQPRRQVTLVTLARNIFLIWMTHWFWDVHDTILQEWGKTGLLCPCSARTWWTSHCHSSSSENFSISLTFPHVTDAHSAHGLVDLDIKTGIALVCLGAFYKKEGRGRNFPRTRIASCPSPPFLHIAGAGDIPLRRRPPHS